MNNFFNPNNPYMKFLEIVCNMMIVNVYTMFLFFPIITIGPAVTAMIYVLSKIIKGEEKQITATYFQSFKTNFKESFILSVLHFMLLSGLVSYILIFGNHASNFSVFIKILIYILIILSCLLALFTYGLLSQYQNTALESIKNAAVMMLGFLPRTFVVLLIICIFGYIYAKLFSIIAPIIFLLGFTLPGLSVVFILMTIFKQVSNSSMKYHHREI